jgi:hypothetical protein
MQQLTAFLELDSLVKIKINNNYFNEFTKSLYLKGIYKQDYINELYKRYAGPSDQIIQVSINPTWDEHGQNEDEDGEQVNDNQQRSNYQQPRRQNYQQNDNNRQSVNRSVNEERKYHQKVL